MFELHGILCIVCFLKCATRMRKVRYWSFWSRGAVLRPRFRSATCGPQSVRPCGARQWCQAVRMPSQAQGLVDGRAGRHSLACQGMWECLLVLVQEHSLQLGLTFIDGTNIPAHHSVARAAMSEKLWHNQLVVRRLTVLVAALAPGPASPLIALAASWSSCRPRNRGPRSAIRGAATRSAAVCSRMDRR